MSAETLSAEITPDPATTPEALREVMNTRYNDTGIDPLADRVLVRRIAEREARGNIAIPENAREKPIEGTVLAIGPGRDLESGFILPCRVVPGERIVFGMYAGVNLPEEYGKDLLLLRVDEILAVRKA